MSAVVFVAGTGTDIGKTWVGAALAELGPRPRHGGARAQARAVVRARRREHRCRRSRGATGEAADGVCPRHRWYAVPLAPPMAASELGRSSFTIADLAAETLVTPEGITLVEGAGGVRSPLANDGDNVALVAALDPALVILVADAGLGTINAVRLSANAARGPGARRLPESLRSRERCARAQPRLAAGSGRLRCHHRHRCPYRASSASSPIVRPARSLTLCTASRTPGMNELRS